MNNCYLVEAASSFGHWYIVHVFEDEDGAKRCAAKFGVNECGTPLARVTPYLYVPKQVSDA